MQTESVSWIILRTIRDATGRPTSECGARRALAAAGGGDCGAMNKRDNPYTPGAGRKPPVLAGRDPDLENVQALVERLSGGGYERSLIYSGLRGVGKTVLLLEFDVLASEAGWATTDVQEVGSQPDFRVTFARMAARLLREMSRKHRIKIRVDRALGVMKAFSIAVAGTVQLKLEVEPASGIADSGDPEQDLSELLIEIGEVAQTAQSGALFLIDEMHNLDTPSLAAICIALQAISRRGLPVALVGAGLPDLQVRLISAKPYADRLFQYHELGRLPDGAARAALVGPAATLGIEFQEKAARQVVRESAGYPYFVQEYGLELWNHAERSPITSADLETVREIVNDSLARSFFGPRFQLATDAEQRYLAAMAALGDPPGGRSPRPRTRTACTVRASSGHLLFDTVARNDLHPLPRHGLARNSSRAAPSDTLLRESAVARSAPRPAPAGAAVAGGRGARAASHAGPEAAAALASPCRARLLGCYWVIPRPRNEPALRLAGAC